MHSVNKLCDHLVYKSLCDGGTDKVSYKELSSYYSLSIYLCHDNGTHYIFRQGCELITKNMYNVKDLLNSCEIVCFIFLYIYKFINVKHPVQANPKSLQHNCVDFVTTIVKDDNP